MRYVLNAIAVLIVSMLLFIAFTALVAAMARYL